MKLTTLKTVLDYAKHFLTNQDFIAILQHFAFDGETVIAFNDIQACQLKLKTNLSCTIPGNLLIRLINTMSAEEIEIQENKTKNSVDISCGKTKAKLPMLPLEDFVFGLPESTERPLTLTSNVIDGMRKCLMNVSANPTRPEFNGINLVIESDQLSLYSTDAETISRFRLRESFNVDPLTTIQVIIPAFFCEKLTTLHPSLVGKNANVEVQFDQKWVITNLDNNFLFTRVIDRNPPDCEGAILKYVPNLNELELWDIPDELGSILDRAVLFLEPARNVNTSSFTIKGNEIKIHTSSSIGTSTDTLQAPVDLGNFSFKLSPIILLRAFKNCKTMTIKKNVIVMQDEDFLHVIATQEL